MLNCTARSDIRYKGGPYSAPKTIFQQLENFDIEVPEELRFNRFRAVYDFESRLSPVQAGNYVYKHIPVSVSIVSNVEGFDKPKTFVNESPLDLVRDFVHYLDKISKKQASLNYSLYGEILSDLDSKIQATEAKKNVKQVGRLRGIKRRLCKFIFQLCTVGFNSQAYDLILIKPFFYSVLKEMDAFADEMRGRGNMTYSQQINKGTSMLSFETTRLKFLDILNFCPPQVNYKKYLKAYGSPSGQKKYFFPYEKMKSYSSLLSSDFPKYEDFFSTLKNENSLDEGKGQENGLKNYRDMCLEWTGDEYGTKFKDGKSLKDLLIRYNEADVVPFLEALSNQFEIFKTMGIDIMSDGYTLPSCALKWCFKGEEGKFHTVPSEFAKIDTLLRDSIVGGPAIVFRRHCKVGDKIRNRHEHLVKALKTWDCNGMYPATFLKMLPGGSAVLREGPDFVPQKVDTSVPGASLISYEWLQYMAIKDNVDIRSAFNGGEVCLGDKAVPVDGWCRKKQIAYQFHGCLFHACQKCKAGETTEWLKTSPEERRRKTVETDDYIRSLGYDLKFIYECEWNEMKTDPEVFEIIKDVVRKPSASSSDALTQDEILMKILKGEIFGFAQVSMHVPDDRKDYFADLPPFFKNVNVNRKDLGPFMASVCERVGELKHPRKQLISSYFCEETLLHTEMICWLLEKGCVCTQIFRVIEYSPVRCFGDKVLESAQLRREADEEPAKKPFGDAIKLCITSVYGKTAENKLKQTRTRIVTQDKVHRAIASKRFKDLACIPSPECNFRSNHPNPRDAFRDSVDEIDGAEEFEENAEIEDQLYEVTYSPTKVFHDRPVQIAVTVYQYAKLRILSFAYDFLHYYFDSKRFMFLYMDTDSLCLAVDGGQLEDILLPSKRDEYFENVHLWLPGESCPKCRENYIKTKKNGSKWRQEGCCASFERSEQRTPNLFKIESEATEGIFLTSKTYALFDARTDTTKYSSKGLQKANDLKIEMFKKVLYGSGEAGEGINRGFKRLKTGSVFSYEQVKAGLSFIYCKRKVLANNVDTEPLDL